MTIRTEERGAADRLLSLVLNSSAHVWHNRPGVNLSGVWYPGTPRYRGMRLPSVAPGLFAPAAVGLYGQLLDIYRLDAELAARFASYALTQTDWRDLQICCAALMLVQPRAGAPVPDDDGTVAFYDDDYRAVGEAMVLRYVKGSVRMLSPKGVLRIAVLLETPEIAALNRTNGFGDPAGRKPPLGRWRSAARQWLAYRENNLPLLEGLVTAGYKETIKQLARKCGYRPQSERFFEILGWAQKQADTGHRRVGLDGLVVARRERFDGLSEVEICERIVRERLSYKDVVGRLPKGLGLSPAIMVALLPSLSDRDLRILSPTLESLGLLADPEIRQRWEKAVSRATDLRALTIAGNMRGAELRETLESAAESAVRTAVSESVADEDVHVMFLIDKSGSMQGAIEKSKEALIRILAGFPAERLYIGLFDAIGRAIRLKATNRAGVKHALDPVTAGGGTTHGSALRALAADGVRVPESAKLLVIVVGDEAGESGASFALSFFEHSYSPAALALVLNVEASWTRGTTVRDAAAELQVPYSEVSVEAFDDPYQVTRALKALLDAPVATGTVHKVQTMGWLDKVLATPLLAKP
jgi:Mg-chelatase subunit ChlD